MNFKDTKDKYTFDDLVEIVSLLRAPGGCPWDREQTHQSIKKNLIEEGYELIEAIDGGNPEKIADESGDLLLQVVFHAKLAEQEQAFNFNDVVEAITQKMIRRHPHIFSDVAADDAETVLANWEEIKKREKAGQPEANSIMSKLPPTLPALLKAEKVQQKAHRVGFDWDDMQGPKDKIQEELAEIDAAVAGNGDLEEEIGDLLFSVVNLSRFVNVDPEQALNRSVQKFVDRFQAMEAKIMLDKKAFDNYTVEELDILWEKSKAEEKKSR